jgi:hypothetical protein
LGIHSARLDIGDRDLEQDESLGLNCAWYADILMTLTDASKIPPPEVIEIAPPDVTEIARPAKKSAAP